MTLMILAQALEKRKLSLLEMGRKMVSREKGEVRKEKWGNALFLN